MNTFGSWKLGALLTALLVVAPGCGQGADSSETDEMEALFLDGEDGALATDEMDPDGGSDSHDGQDTGFGDPEVQSVDLDVMPRDEEPEPIPQRRAATPPAPVEPKVEEPAPPTVRAGTRIALSSEIELSTADVLPGDPVIATVTDDVIGPDGMVLIPQGSKFLGRVTRAESSTGSDVDPVLEIRFETLSTEYNEWAVETATVEVEMESSRKDSDKRTAAKIGGAAVVGGLLGKVIGKDTEDAVKGAAAGAVIGTVVAMETRAGEAKIKAGALIVIELVEALILQ